MKLFRSLTTSATKNDSFPRRKILNGVALTLSLSPTRDSCRKTTEAKSEHLMDAQRFKFQVPGKSHRGLMIWIASGFLSPTLYLAWHVTKDDCIWRWPLLE